MKPDCNRSQWRISSLGELATYTNGRAFKKEEWKETGLPIIRIQNLNDPDASFNYTDKEHEARYRVRHGDLLVTWAASLGAHIWQGGDAWVNQHIFRVEPREEIASKKFLFYAIKKALPELYRKAHGSGMVHVTRGVFDSHPVLLAPRKEQDEIVAEIEKQFSRLDEAVGNLKRVKVNLTRYERGTIQELTDPLSLRSPATCRVADLAISLDNLRRPVNKAARAKRPGTIPYLGANGQTGWIDVPLFDEELVLVVEDETFVGRTQPFSYYHAGKCWVNNHTHVLRARREVVLPRYLNLALSYYPFIPMTTGSTGRRKLTKAALMAATLSVPTVDRQTEILEEVDRRLTIVKAAADSIVAAENRCAALRAMLLADTFDQTDIAVLQTS